jgi:hypothetical protein
MPRLPHDLSPAHSWARHGNSRNADAPFPSGSERANPPRNRTAQRALGTCSRQALGRDSRPEGWLRAIAITNQGGRNA